MNKYETNFFSLTKLSINIYAITCKVCGIQYVGQTKLRLKDRFVHHLRDIAIHDVTKPVGNHYNKPNHKGTKDLEITILEFIKKPPYSPAASAIRLRIESHWTHTLRTLSPSGLNMENPKEYKS